MRKRVYISLFAVTLLTASAARADLTAMNVAVPPDSAGVVSQIVEQAAALDTCSLTLLSIPNPLSDLAPAANRSARPTSEIRSIPAAPDSTVLCLWALGSIGAWQIARSSRNVNFSALPEWYHADAPQQIGHVTLFTLEFGAMQAAAFDRPAYRLQLSSIACRNRERWLPPQQRHVLTCDPRGPPSSGE